MTKSKIEWTQEVWNVITGCEIGCEYCYARKFAYRLAGRCGYPLLDPFSPIFHPERLNAPFNIKKPSKIFVSSMGDMWGRWVSHDWINQVLSVVRRCPQHTFIFLTKNPSNYKNFDIPLNAWIGYSTTRTLYHEWLSQHDDNIKFVSLEPVHNKIDATIDRYASKINLQWLIIGSESGNRKDKPVFRREWLDSTINFADRVGIPIFIKDNAIKEVAKTSCYIPTRYRMQEFPFVSKEINIESQLNDLKGET